jgi:hypothetical protein
MRKFNLDVLKHKIFQFCWCCWPFLTTDYFHVVENVVLKIIFGHDQFNRINPISLGKVTPEYFFLFSVQIKAIGNGNSKWCVVVFAKTVPQNPPLVPGATDLTAVAKLVVQ